MNSNIFRLVFNKKTGQLVPVAETTTSNGKGSAGNSASGVGGSPQSASGKGLLTWSLLTAAAAAAYLTIPIMGGSAFAADVLPTQGQVINGNATVNVNGRVMTVQQLSSVLGVNWQSFSIGAGNTVVFQQPNAASVAINRVIGNNRSEIYGNLRANGQVFLLNPNGVLFGKGSEISVGGLVASTAADATRNAKGQWQLTGGGSNSVINQGNIKATDGGYVVLAGAQSNNEGSITANQGTVALAAGGNVTLTLDNASLLSVKVDEATLNALAQNKGLIQADGGAVYLTAAGRNTLLNTVVNNEGLIQARALGVKDGQVVLMAEGGDAVTTGAIDVSGQNTGEKGGAVAIGGNRVGVFGNASIHASGVAGGGRVVIGGDSLGKATDVASIGFADNTVVDGAATIKVGSSQGDGGFVETSGKKLSMLGRIDGQAAGKNGEWLIDPTDITIGSVTTANATQATGNWTVTGDTATVNISSINAALDAGTNVTITTNSSGAGNGDITLSNHILKTTGARSSLTLTADRSILLNGNIQDTSAASALDVVLNATQSTQGNVTFANYLLLTTNGTVAVNVPRGNVVLGVNGNTFSAGTGSINVTATTNVANQNVISGGVLNTSGNVTMSGTSTAITGNATGVALIGINVTGGGGGTTKLIGKGSGYGAGVQVNTNTTAVSGDVLNITGQGDVYAGVAIYGNVTGNVNYAGTSYFTRSFLITNGTSIDATNNGMMSGNITFSSNATGKTAFVGNVSVKGNVSIQNYGAGIYSGNAKGIDLTNANVSVNNGTLSLIASNYYSNNLSSTGIDLTNAKLTVGSNASVVVNQAYVKSAVSSNASSAGILMNGTTITGNFSVNQAQDIVLNGTNTLNASGGSQLVQSTNGTLSISGVTNTNGSVVLGDTGGLNMTGTLNVTGGAVRIFSNASSMTLGNITGAGNITLGGIATNGNITQLTGTTFNVTGTTQVALGTADATLTNNGNNFSGGLSASSVGNLSASSNSSLALGGIAATGSLSLNTASGNGNITQLAGSNLTVGGNTSLSAGTGNITLVNSNNLLTGQVSVTNATAVTVVNNMAMNVGAASSTGDLAFSTKTGNLTLNGNMVSTGGNVTVSAGTASAVASTAVTNGNVTGGDVIKGTATSISAGTGKTVTMYSGNANTASLASLVTNGTTSQNKAYATAAGAGTSNVSRALNVFYRVSPTLTISGASAQNKVYDGTTAAVVNGTVAGGIDGDTVSTSVIGTFANKTVGTGKSIALALVSAPTASANLSVGNYTIPAPPVLTANITTATLAVTGLTASDKAYDGNTNATLGGTAAVTGFGSDVVSVSGTSAGTFADKNAGLNKTVTVSGLTLTGADASNYVIGQPASLTANITAAAVTITANAQTKTYDGTTTVSNASAYTTTGVIAGESLTASLAYTDKNAGAANKTIAVSGATAGANTSLSNYNVTYANNTASTIDKAAVTITAGSQTKTYDGTTNVNNTSAYTTTGVIAGESLTASLAYTDKNAGAANKTIAASGATAGANTSLSNYNVSYTNNTASTIDKAAVTIAANAQTKAYDGTTTVSNTSAYTTTGVVAGESITASLAYTDKNAGAANKTIAVSGATAGANTSLSNYNVSYTNNTASTIDKAAVTIAANAQTKTYDGTTTVSNASAYTTTGVVAGESITASLAYADKNAGVANKTIAVSGAIAGANTSLSNYNVSYTNNTASTIDKANITGISGVTLSDKTYDGTTNASFNASAATFTGKVAGDTLTLTGGTGGFASKNVGNNINVSVSNMTLGGADAGNYNVTGGTPTFNGTANITAAAVTITANTQSKTYDGTTIVSNTSAYTTTGVVAGESITASLAYTDKNAGAANKTIVVSGATAGANTSLSNYNVSYTNNTISTINKADLTAAVNNDAKFVTQTDNASYAGISYSGFVGGDTSGTAVTGGTVSRTNTGTETAGTYNGVLTASNITAANYNITVQAGNFTIVPADQLLVRVTNTNSTYGSAANLTVSSAQYMNSTNVISNLTLSSQSGNTYSYSDGVGGQATFTLSPLNSTVSTSGNTVVGAYQLGATNVTTQNAVNFNSNLTVVGALTVDKANISSVSGISAANKVYDGTTNATLDTSSAVFNGKVSGDSLSVSSASGAFVDPTVGTAKIVNISGVTLGGTDVANYVLLSPTATTTANITAVTIIPPTTDTATTTDTGYLVSTTATKLGLVGNSSLTDVLRLSPQNEIHKKGTSSLVAINRGGISLPAYIPLYSDEPDNTKESN